MNNSQRSCVLFERLTFGVLPVMAMARVLGKKVFYMDAWGKLRDVEVRKRLAAWGIQFVPYETFQNATEYDNFPIAARFVEQLTNDIFDRDLIEKSAQLFKCGGNAQKKLEVMLFDTLVDRCWTLSEIQDIANQLEHAGWKVHLFFFTNTTTRLLFSHGLVQHVNLAPDIVSQSRNAFQMLHILGRTGVGYLRRLFARLSLTKTGTQRVEPDASPHEERTGEVLYFPHKGPTYGELFFKDQYFSADPGSAYHPSHITYCEIAPVEEGVRRCYDRFSLPYEVINAVPVRNVTVMKALKRIFGFSQLFPFDSAGHALAMIMLRLYPQFLGYCKSFAAFPKAQVALVGYDLLFPIMAVLALQSRNISVVALQERLFMTFFATSALILDHYFVSGEVVRKEISQRNSYCIGKIYVTGMARVDKLRTIKPFWPKFEICGTHRTLILDFHSVADVMSENDGTAICRADNKLFYQVVIRLAEDFPTVTFVLRSKDAVWHKLAFFKDIFKQLEALPNMQICQDYKSFDKSYAYVAASDSIVCRHTSLADEAMAVGKQVICYEEKAPGKSVVRDLYDYAGAPVFVGSFKALQARFSAIVTQGSFETMSQTLREFHYGPSSTGLALPSVHDHLEQILAEKRGRQVS